MKKTGILLFAICQCAFWMPAWADPLEPAEAPSLEAAQVEAGAVISDVSGDKAKYNEYRDLESGLHGKAGLEVHQGDLYMELNADNVGRDDQRYELEGGRYGSFKLNVLYDGIPHNYTYGARSYLDGVGTASLTDSGNAADPAAWTTFDYTKKRKNVSFNGEFSFHTPYYVAFGGGRQLSEGIYPLGGPGGIELPAPVDWEESSWFAEGGFKGNAVVASIRAEKSDFENTNDAMTWGRNTTSLAPDSEYYKVSGRFILRQSFMDATLALRAHHSQKENTTDLSLVDSSTSEIYHGDVKKTGLDISYDFVPAAPFDMKLYGKYSDTEDDSDIITINSLTTEPNDREKTSAGFDGTWQLDAANFVDAGYRYADAKRSSRTDNDRTKDHTLFVQYRNQSFEKINFQGKYERLDRTGDFSGMNAYEYNDDTDTYIVTTADDDGRRRFDVADQIRHRLEFAVDVFVTDRLDAGIEYTWWDSDYKDTRYGLTGAAHHQIYVSGNYTGIEDWSASVYIGYEDDKNELVTNRDWSQAEAFDTVSYGVVLELPAIEEKLRFTVSWDHAIVDGSAAFDSEASEYLDLTHVDDATSQRLDVAGVLSLNDVSTLKLGYCFERFDLDDGQYQGYTYLPLGAILTGAYADPDYRAHTAYIGVALDF